MLKILICVEEKVKNTTEAFNRKREAEREEPQDIPTSATSIRL